MTKYVEIKGKFKITGNPMTDRTVLDAIAGPYKALEDALASAGHEGVLTMRHTASNARSVTAPIPPVAVMEGGEVKAVATGPETPQPSPYAPLHTSSVRGWNAAELDREATAAQLHNRSRTAG